jgi:hypothetical protein
MYEYCISHTQAAKHMLLYCTVRPLCRICSACIQPRDMHPSEIKFKMTGNFDLGQGLCKFVLYVLRPYLNILMRLVVLVMS